MIKQMFAEDSTLDEPVLIDDTYSDEYDVVAPTGTPYEEKERNLLVDAAIVYLLLMGIRTDTITRARLRSIAIAELKTSAISARLVLSSIANIVIKETERAIKEGRIDETLKPVAGGAGDGRDGAGGSNEGVGSGQPLPGGSAASGVTTIEALAVAALGKLRTGVAITTNLLGALAKGRHSEQMSNDGVELLQYKTMEDSRVRPRHAKLNNIVLPKKHVWWKRNYPPNGYDCRCFVKKVDKNTPIFNGTLVDGVDDESWSFSPVEENTTLQGLLDDRIASIRGSSQ